MTQSTCHRTLTAGSKMLSRERLWTEFVDKRQWLLKFWWRLEFNSTISQTFLFLSGWKLQGKVSQRCWSCPSSRQWSINSTKKNANNCRCNRGFTWCSEMRSETIHWFGLRAINRFITYEGKNALITVCRIRGVCYESMGRNNTVIRAGKITWAPPSKKDGPLHAVHWLEMRIPEVQKAIFKKGKKYLGLNFIFLMDMLLL